MRLLRYFQNVCIFNLSCRSCSKDVYNITTWTDLDVLVVVVFYIPSPRSFHVKQVQILAGLDSR